MRKARAVLLVCGLAAPAMAADDASLQRALELPAHRMLMRVIDAKATPFVSDGCSGGLSQVWAGAAEVFPGFAAAHEGLPPWEACCVTHDARYHDAGGAIEAEASYDARLAADEALRECVAATGAARAATLAPRYGVSEDQVLVGYDAIAAAMFTAVRLGGGPCTGLPWRWGFGYSGCLMPPPL